MKDRGEIKTLPKPRSNEKSHLYLDGIGDIVHCDIAYGTGSVIRGTWYVLVRIDKASINLYEYGPKPLKSQSSLQTMKKIINDIGDKQK